MGEYHGVDINSKCKRFEEKAAGVHIHIGSQNDAEFLRQLVQSVADKGAFDLIIDDASHNPTLTLQSFQLLWPALNPMGGRYMIEDLKWQPSVVEYFSGAWYSLPDVSSVQHYERILMVVR